jgi:DNA-binding CsgD family transcriptional regulator
MPNDTLVKLTERERRFTDLLMETRGEVSYKELAGRLGCSLTNFKQGVNRAYKRVGVKGLIGFYIWWSRQNGIR